MLWYFSIHFPWQNNLIYTQNKKKNMHENILIAQFLTKKCHFCGISSGSVSYHRSRHSSLQSDDLTFPYRIFHSINLQWYRATSEQKQTKTALLIEININNTQSITIIIFCFFFKQKTGLPTRLGSFRFRLWENTFLTYVNRLNRSSKASPKPRVDTIYGRMTCYHKSRSVLVIWAPVWEFFFVLVPG